MSSPTSNNRRKSKAAWSNEDDIRLCRAFVMATQDDSGTEHVKNMWTRVYTHYADLVAEEDPMAAPRAGGALQTHWSSFIRPEAAFFISILAKVEKEEHEGWKEEDFMREANIRFEVIRQEEEAEAIRLYNDAKHQADLDNTEQPPKPRTKPTTFRYPHCIPVLKTSNRFMRAALSEKKPRAVSTQKRRGPRPKSAIGTEMIDGSEVSDGSVGPTQKRHKGSDVSSRASASASASSSSSSPSDDSSDEGVPMPKGVVFPAAPASRGVQQPIAQERSNGVLPVPAQVIRTQRSQQKANYRLKLLAELRGIVETISQLTNQLDNGTAAPMGMTAGSRLDPTLREEVQHDLRFFREQKRRLMQELSTLDASEGQA
ncbi:hypothetical protein DVH05_025370 [Phytophthora capsici]|nr:hypothetical protein DVH05_025370 [Phytophthora capsici]